MKNLFVNYQVDNVKHDKINIYLHEHGHKFYQHKQMNNTELLKHTFGVHRYKGLDCFNLASILDTC